MASEIKRNIWTRFCKKFSADNQYRPTQIKTKPGNGDSATTSLMPFMGIAVSKRGRLIEGIQFYAGRADSRSIAEPIFTIERPAKILLEKDESGADRSLRIRSLDGNETCLELIGDREPAQTQQFIEKVAYALYEERGYTTGKDTDDWFEAERRVHTAESHLTE